MREHRNSIPEARSRPAAGHLTAAVRPAPRRHITVAEHERAAISERTKAALAAAKPAASSSVVPASPQPGKRPSRSVAKAASAASVELSAP